MTFVFITDNQYAMQTAVTLKSLINTNRKCIGHIYFLTPERYDDRIKQLLDMCDSSGLSYTISIVDKKDLLPFEGISDWPTSTFIKLLIPRYLPLSVHNCLYLDSDILITGDIEQIIIPHNSAVAAVEDIPFSTEHKRRCGLNDNDAYINSGVMLMNLDKWREKCSDYQIFTGFIVSQKDKLRTINDQDIISCVFAGDIALLPYEFNVTNAYWGFNIPIIKANKEIWIQARRQAKIIHFTNWRKPWVPEVCHPYKSKYISTLKQTNFGTQLHMTKCNDIMWHAKSAITSIGCSFIDVFRRFDFAK